MINKNTIDFCILTLYTVMLLNLLLILIAYWYIWDFSLICNHVCNFLPFISFIFPLTRISNTIINRNGHTGNLFLF